MVKILLDNGHGYDTPGKRSPIWPDGSQLFEWEFNRDIVSRIENSIEKGRYLLCPISTRKRRYFFIGTLQTGQYDRQTK